MASLPVMNGFEARLATWTNIASCPFAQDNEVAAASPADYFIEIEYPLAVEDRESLGDTGSMDVLFRETGAARFVITVKRFKSGWKAVVGAWVEELRDLFRSSEFAGIETLEASPAVFDDANKDGTRYRVPFVVLYQYDVNR